ncbi:mRNA export protein (contains WD40 repeats) [Pseudoloma neurophilia]|uniref:mRNA export protein (Contains WD40 repeats) n=1 Tax=Pseudoloma neurophilia TaxID=146866 RepID=A0A0R0M0B2_9MICR|nr:mRNA export protein (contains WD40 repeats) [Pseudoloma neurophilia]
MFFDSTSHTKTASVSPADSVSDITLHPSFDVFAVTTWDNSIYFYDFSLEHKTTTKVSAPLLSGQFFDGSKIVAGAATGTLFINDFNTNQTNEIKAHEKGIQSCKLYNNIILTGSWDNNIKFWDLRSDQPVHTLNVDSKIYAMDIQGDHVVAALANNQLAYYNIKDLNTKQILKTKFKYQLRSLRCATDKVFVGGIEGAIEAITFADTSDTLYKQHRNGNMVYTVNTIDINPINSSLIASGGSDGTFIIYNKPSRYKVHSNKENSPVTSCKFTKDGGKIIYAIGEDWSKGYPSSKVETKINMMDLKQARISV